MVGDLGDFAQPGEEKTQLGDDAPTMNIPVAKVDLRKAQLDPVQSNEQWFEGRPRSSSDKKPFFAGSIELLQDDEPKPRADTALEAEPRADTASELELAMQAAADAEGGPDAPAGMPEVRRPSVVTPAPSIEAHRPTVTPAPRRMSSFPAPDASRADIGRASAFPSPPPMAKPRGMPSATPLPADISEPTPAQFASLKSSEASNSAASPAPTAKTAEKPTSSPLWSPEKNTPPPRPKTAPEAFWADPPPKFSIAEPTHEADRSHHPSIFTRIGIAAGAAIALGFALFFLTSGDFSVSNTGAGLGRPPAKTATRVTKTDKTKTAALDSNSVALEPKNTVVIPDDDPRAVYLRGLTMEQQLNPKPAAAKKAADEFRANVPFDEEIEEPPVVFSASDVPIPEAEFVSDKEPIYESASELPVTPTQLVVNVIPWGRVFVDDKDVGFPPVLLPSIAPGPHTIRVERSGFKTLTREVVAKEGRRQLVHIRFTE